jgi:GNAT superfamily N-acetyltransferase
MPEIEIRPVVASDIPALIALDHNYYSDHVWQLEISSGKNADPLEVLSSASERVHTASFRQVRLPRQVLVEYPYPHETLADDWKARSGLLAALLEGSPIGYASLMLNIAPLTTWVTDLVVSFPLRRQGIGKALVMASLEWADQMESQNLVLEMQTRNYPAIQLAYKLGFELCGYNDRHYPDHQIGIFFGKSLR